MLRYAVHRLGAIHIVFVVCPGLSEYLSGGWVFDGMEGEDEGNVSAAIARTEESIMMASTAGYNNRLHAVELHATELSNPHRVQRRWRFFPTRSVTRLRSDQPSISTHTHTHTRHTHNAPHR